MSVCSSSLRDELRKLSLILALFFTLSCSSDEESEPETSTFVSSELIASNPVNEFRILLQLTGVDVDVENWRYDVELFRINYTTEVEGAEVLASALVIIPQTDNEVGLVSFHRGTITAHSEAPTEIRPGDPIAALYSGLSSLGLVAVFPDMIGFGASQEMVHPYYVEDINTRTVRHAISATREFALDREVALTGDLYLAGYSQGGYITMATQISIEQTPLSGLDLRASFPAAGAFDVKGLQEHFFSLQTYEQPYYMAYVGLAYLEYEMLDVELGEIFNEPFAERIPTLFDGSLPNTAINEQLSFEIEELLFPSFINGLETDPTYETLNNLLIENGLLDWTPTVPTFLYHGDADTFIPVENTIDTYNRLLENGTDDELLSLTIFEGADHGGGVIPYAEDLANRLIELIEEE